MSLKPRLHLFLTFVVQFAILIQKSCACRRREWSRKSLRLTSGLAGLPHSLISVPEDSLGAATRQGCSGRNWGGLGAESSQRAGGACQYPPRCQRSVTCVPKTPLGHRSLAFSTAGFELYMKLWSFVQKGSPRVSVLCGFFQSDICEIDFFAVCAVML